jgi:hypothetical protein
MLFHSAILHRGTCAGHGKFIRAHVHMRIARARAAGELSRSNLEDFTNPGLLAAASAPWRRALTLDLPAPVKWASTPEPVTDRSARGTLRRLVHGLAYRSTPLVGPLLPKDYAYRKLYVPPEDVSFYDGVTSP